MGSGDAAIPNNVNSLDYFRSIINIKAYREDSRLMTQRIPMELVTFA